MEHLMKRVLVVLVMICLVLAGCDKQEDRTAFEPKTSSQPEFVAKAPAGKMSPVYHSEAEVKRYIEQHSKDFPTGTVIYRR